jgi:ATP-dependent DNA helicase RecQ
MHDFFLERDYPAITELTRVADLLNDDYQMPDLLRQRLKMDAETFDKAVEKLIAQGAANIDMAGNVRAAEDAPRQTAWRKGYDEQIAFRRGQIDRMVQFAESPQCRMAALIQHFGDTADGLRPCGHCDFCAPQNATAQTFRPPTTEEDRQLRAVLRALDGQTRATGKLHTELSTGALRNTPAVDRKVFDTLLDALVRSGLITLNSDQWTNPEGNLINFKKAALTHEGRTLTGPLPPNLLLKDTTATSSTSSRKKPRTPTGTRPSKASLKAEREQTTAAYTPEQRSIEAALRTWRKAEAAKTGKPAFMVFGDSVLHNVVLARPTRLAELHTVSGIGPEKADRYGADIIAICRLEAPGTPNTIDRNDKEASSRPKTASYAAAVEGPPHVVRSAENIAPDRTVSTQSSLVGRTARKLTAVQQTKQNFKLAAEDLKPLSVSSAAGRARAKAYDESAYRRLDLEDDLRVFAETQSQALNQPASKLLSEAAIAEILRFRPRSLTELDRLENLRADLPSSFFQSLLATCLAEYSPERTPIRQPSGTPNAVDHLSIRGPAKSYTRQRAIIPEPTDTLTPEQQALDQRLREWRKAESEKLNLPLFFVLASTTLRSIVLARPQTLTQLKAVHGLGGEKIEKFGPGIIEVCNT